MPEDFVKVKSVWWYWNDKFIKKQLMFWRKVKQLMVIEQPIATSMANLFDKSWTVHMKMLKVCYLKQKRISMVIHCLEQVLHLLDWTHTTASVTCFGPNFSDDNTPALPRLLLPIYSCIRVSFWHKPSHFPHWSPAHDAISSINAHHTRLVKLFSIWSMWKLF